MEEPILNSHNKAEYEHAHSGDFDTPNEKHLTRTLRRIVSLTNDKQQRRDYGI